jgi:hypothetical protein
VVSGNSKNYIKLKWRTEKYWPINYVLCQIIMTTEKCSERLVSVWNCYMKIKVVTFDDITSITNLILNFVSFYVDVDDDGKSQFKGLTYALWAFRPEYLIRRNKFSKVALRKVETINRKTFSRKWNQRKFKFKLIDRYSSVITFRTS